MNYYSISPTRFFFCHFWQILASYNTTKIIFSWLIKFCIAAWEKGSWGYMRYKNYVESHCINVNYIILSIFIHRNHYFRYFVLTWLMDGTICRRSDGPTGQKTWPTDRHNLLLNCPIPPYNWNSIIHILLVKSSNNFIPTNIFISQISMRTGVVT